MLEVRDVRVELDGRPVLHDVSLTVDDGETVALLGPSGSGKTTLLRLIAGLQDPVAGAVILDGREMAGVPVHHRNVGLMFQDYALFPHRTVAGNVEFGLRMHGMSPEARRNRVCEVLEMVGLTGFESRSVSALSGGERLRVALARSLAPRPSLLMLDEPLGSLDRTLRDRLVLDLRELFDAQGLGVIYVTHDQAEALALADRIVVLDRGRVVQADTPRELWVRPASPFVARFLGFSNLLDVKVVQGEVRVPFGVIGRAPSWPDGPAIALVRPTAVRLVERSPLVAEVRGVAFHGEHTTVELGVGPERLEANVTSTPPRPGDVVHLDIDPAGLQLFEQEADGAASSGLVGQAGAE